jgi:hypothetical protein
MREGGEANHYQADRRELKCPDDHCKPSAELPPQPRFEAGDQESDKPALAAN